MTAQIIDGKAIATTVLNSVESRIHARLKSNKRAPSLAVILIGGDPASAIYVRNKRLACEKVGIRSIAYDLPVTTTESELLDLINQLNQDGNIDGILVQSPLPPQIKDELIIEHINPNKDVDGFHVINAGRLATGMPGLVPCTPLGCLMLIQDVLGKDNLSGKHAVVVGRSNIVGKPMAQLLLRESCTVTIAHSRTKDLPEECRRADILVAAVGRAQMVKGEWIKPGAIVIDVGINRIPPAEAGGKDRLVGDVDYASAAQVAGAITPVPGGVGPMTIACLLANTVTAACALNDIEVPNV